MERYSCSVLSNGLRVVTVGLPHLHSAELAVYIKAGGRNDPPGKTGLSHFLEHILFRGTEDYANSFEIESAFESLGGGINAATDADSTCFYGRIHPRFTLEGLEILSSLILRPKLDGVELERRIIIEEALEDINQGGDEISTDILAGRMLWPDHPLGEPTVGNLPDIKRITRKDLEQHLGSWYLPNNSLVIAAGPLKHEQILLAAERFFGSWQPAELPPSLPVPEQLPNGPACHFVKDADSQICIQLAFRTCRRSAPEMTTLKFLRRILAGGGSSRLHLILREKLGLIYSVDAGIGSYDETGCLSIDLSTAPENLPAVLSATVEELGLLASHRVPEREMERIRTVYLAELDYSRDSVGEMGIRFGWGTLMDVAHTIDQDQQLVHEVTPNMILELAATIFRPENRFLAVVGPIEKIDQDKIYKILTTYPPL